MQSAVKGKLEQDFSTYQKRENLNDAEAVRDLLTFALRIKLNDSDDTKPTTRELIEEIYRTVRCASAIGDIIHGQTFDGEKLYRDQKDSKPQRHQVKADIEQKVEAYLSGEKKG